MFIQRVRFESLLCIYFLKSVWKLCIGLACVCHILKKHKQKPLNRLQEGRVYKRDRSCSMFVNTVVTKWAGSSTQGSVSYSIIWHLICSKVRTENWNKICQIDHMLFCWFRDYDKCILLQSDNWYSWLGIKLLRMNVSLQCCVQNSSGFHLLGSCIHSWSTDASSLHGKSVPEKYCIN